MKIAVFTPTRNPGLAVSYYSIAKQTMKPDYWFVADQLAPERDWVYEKMRKSSPEIKIESYCAEISPGKVGNLAHVSNWALRRARETNVDLLVFLQDFIWIRNDGIEKFAITSKIHPFDLITGRVDSSAGPKRYTFGSQGMDMWNIFGDDYWARSEPPQPHTPDTRVQMGFPKIPHFLSNHAWEINWGALPHALINAGVDFDEDYDYGTQWENTQFSFDIWRKFNETFLSRDALLGAGRVWWDYYNIAVGMPHRDYFPKTHEGERDHDNGHRFWSKNPDLVGAA